MLAQSYTRIGYQNKALRVADCGTFLEFAHEIQVDGVIAEKGKLHNANFCKDRLCPMCSWRRSYKIFAQVSQIMEQIGSDYKFLFLTLTVPNCAPESLSETISRLMLSWNRLIDYKRFKKAIKGFFRALEVTRNFSNGSYHPHFHCVLAVSKSYGKHSDYINHDEWLEMWRIIPCAERYFHRLGPRRRLVAFRNPQSNCRTPVRREERLRHRQLPQTARPALSRPVCTRNPGRSGRIPRNARS